MKTKTNFYVYHTEHFTSAFLKLEKFVVIDIQKCSTSY